MSSLPHKYMNYIEMTVGDVSINQMNNAQQD